MLIVERLIDDLKFLASDIRPLTSSASLAKKCIFVIPALIFLSSALGASTDSSPFNGTWKREDTDDTVTIYVTGDTAIVTTSGGGRGTGLFDGQSILYSGTVETEEGPVKTLGTYQLSADGKSLTKHREIYYAAGKQEEDLEYTRVNSDSSSPPASSTSKSTPASLPASRMTPAPTATPKPISSEPFVGTWRPADDSAKLTITLSGRNATLKYSSGSRETGTVRGTKLECDTMTSNDGIKSTDHFEMSANGRTLIRRRTVESSRGQTGHETLTYNRE